MDRTERQRTAPQTVSHPPAEPTVPVLLLHCLAFYFPLFAQVRARSPGDRADRPYKRA
jgi:hypothetical protein